jgi:hypothetical protein
LGDQIPVEIIRQDPGEVARVETIGSCDGRLLSSVIDGLRDLVDLVDAADLRDEMPE